MGSLFKSASQKSSNTETKILEEPNNNFEDIIDLLIKSGNPNSIGSVNLPVLATYVERFPDLVKHSEKTSKSKVIHKKAQKTSSEEVAPDSKETGTSSNKKSSKTKKTRGSRSSQRVTRTASKFQELTSSQQDVKDFFGSLAWYESSKSYYDNRLQIVLDDFECSESSETEGGKQYYDYLLLDSRVSELTEWPGFVRAVFYVGKGKNKRALDHTKEAAKVWMTDGKSTSKKISRILDIWRGDGAVIVLTAADGLVEYEALTCEALVIEALGKQRLCNKNYGSFYGVAAVLKAREKRELGATLLVKARERFIEDGADRVPAPVKLEKQAKSKGKTDRVFAPVMLEKQLKSKQESDHVFASASLGKQLTCRAESAETDKEVDKAVLSALITENYSKSQKSKSI